MLKNIIIICIICLLLFYRLPEPKLIKSDDIIYSPAYGKVMEIKEDDSNYYIFIFLSPLDIHYQMVPISGKITNIKYDATGKYNLAYELNKSNDNEKCIYKITNKRGDFYVYQIAGYLVRRISIFKNLGENVNIGEKLGLIHFGSRVDLIVPKKNLQLLIKKNEYVKGTNTIIGKYKN